MEELTEKLEDYIYGLDDNEATVLWNRYCEIANYPDDMVYSMHEIIETYSDWPLKEFLREIDDNFNLQDKFVYSTGYGYMKSAESIFDCIDIDELIDHIISNEDCLDDNNIKELIEEE